MKKLFNKIQLPTCLAEVTQIDPAEVSAEELGLSHQKIHKLWQGVEGLYRTGLYPSIGLAVRKHNQLLLHRVIGYAQGNGPEDLPSTPKLLMQLDTPVCLFSASKCITATLIYWLQSQHEFSLQQPIAHYLPEFKSVPLGRYTADQLLNHRAGIPNFPEGLELTVLRDKKVLTKILAQLPLQWSDNRVGYHALTAGFVLGMLIETITQRSITDVVDEVLRIPMGFTHFNYGLAETYRPYMAYNYPSGVYYNNIMEKKLVRMLGAPLDELIRKSNQDEFLSSVVPSGNFFTTALGVCDFFQMLLNHGQYQGKTILPEDCARLLTKSSGKFEFDRMLNFPIRYSGGFMFGADPVGAWGTRSAQAFGHIGFSNNLCWADPAKQISVSLLTSGNPLLGTHILQLVRWVMQISIYLK